MPQLPIVQNTTPSAGDRLVSGFLKGQELGQTVAAHRQKMKQANLSADMTKLGVMAQIANSGTMTREGLSSFFSQVFDSMESEGLKDIKVQESFFKLATGKYDPAITAAMGELTDDPSKTNEEVEKKHKITFDTQQRSYIDGVRKEQRDRKQFEKDAPVREQKVREANLRKDIIATGKKAGISEDIIAGMLTGAHLENIGKLTERLLSQIDKDLATLKGQIGDRIKPSDTDLARWDAEVVSLEAQRDRLLSRAAQATGIDPVDLGLSDPEQEQNRKTLEDLRGKEDEPTNALIEQALASGNPTAIKEILEAIQSGSK